MWISSAGSDIGLASEDPLKGSASRGVECDERTRLADVHHVRRRPRVWYANVEQDTRCTGRRARWVEHKAGAPPSRRRYLAARGGIRGTEADCHFRQEPDPTSHHTRKHSPRYLPRSWPADTTVRLLISSCTCPTNSMRPRPRLPPSSPRLQAQVPRDHPRREHVVLHLLPCQVRVVGLLHFNV